MGLVANTIFFYHIYYTHRKFLLMSVIWYSKFSNPCRTMCRANNFRFANGKFHYVTRRMRRNVTNHDLVEEQPLPTNENFRFIFACSICKPPLSDCRDFRGTTYIWCRWFCVWKIIIVRYFSGHELNGDISMTSLSRLPESFGSCLLDLSRYWLLFSFFTFIFLQMIIISFEGEGGKMLRLLCFSLKTDLI